jgi:hypothetical protein
MLYYINCLLEGDSEAFTVEIDEARNVGYLKGLIKSHNSETLAAVDAKDLKLYHVNLEYDESDEQERIEQVKGVLHGLSKQKPLNTLRKLSNIGDGFPEELVHIFVQVPQSKFMDSRAYGASLRPCVSHEPTGTTSKDLHHHILPHWG